MLGLQIYYTVEIDFDLDAKNFWLTKLDGQLSEIQNLNIEYSLGCLIDIFYLA